MFRTQIILFGYKTRLYFWVLCMKNECSLFLEGQRISAKKAFLKRRTSVVLSIVRGKGDSRNRLCCFVSAVQAIKGIRCQGYKEFGPSKSFKMFALPIFGGQNGR